MPLHPSVLKALEGIHRTSEAARDIAPALRAASMVANFAHLRGIGHVLRAGYLAVRVARLVGKLLPKQQASSPQRGASYTPSPKPRAATVAPRGSTPPVQRSPRSQSAPTQPPPKPSPTPRAPSPTPAQPTPAAPPPKLSPSERKQLEKQFGKAAADEIEAKGEVKPLAATPRAPQPMTMPSAEQRTAGPKSFAMPSAEQRTAATPRAPRPMTMPSAERRTVPTRPEKSKRAPERQGAAKKWDGWKSQDRDRATGRWNGLEKPGWGGSGKEQSEDGDDPTQDREELLETTKESLATLKEILAALKQSPSEPGRQKPGAPQEGGDEGDETAPGNNSMGDTLKGMGKLGMGGGEAAEGAEVGAETAEGMGSLMELLESAGPLLGLL